MQADHVKALFAFCGDSCQCTLQVSLGGSVSQHAQASSSPATSQRKD